MTVNDANHMTGRGSMRRIGLIVGLVLLCVGSSPSAARAQSQTDQAVNFAVDFFNNTSRTVTGVSIPDGAVPIVKKLVSCALASKSVPECARESVLSAVIEKIPGGVAQRFAKCVTEPGGDVGRCATELLSKVPEQARPLAKCVAEGNNVASCAERFALDQVGGAIDSATKQATEKTLEALKSLKADAEDAMERQLPGSVRNIIMVADGIRKGDYGLVVLGAGPEAAKLVVSTIIQTFLPGLGPIIGPVVSDHIDLHTDLAKDILALVTSDDRIRAELGVKIGEILFKFYMTTFITSPCALVPDGSFKDATCGNLAKVIQGIGDVAGDAARIVLTAAEDILKAVGIYQVGDKLVALVGGVFEDIFGDGLEKPEVCGSGSAFFANNHLKCLGSASGHFNVQPIAGGLNGACVNNFKRCFGDKAGGICSSMGSSFSDQLKKVNMALAEGAATFTAAALGAHLAQNKARLCKQGYSRAIDNAIDDFLMNECTSAMSQSVKLPVDGCKFNPPGKKQSSGHNAACMRGAGTDAARAEMNKTCERHCRDNPDDCKPPPVCTDPATGKIFSYSQKDLGTGEYIPCPGSIFIEGFKADNNKFPGTDDRPPGIKDYVSLGGGLGGGNNSGIGNFIVDGRGPFGGGNDSVRDHFAVGKCKADHKTSNPTMIADRDPSTGTGLLVLKAMNVVGFSGFDNCSIDIKDYVRGPKPGPGLTGGLNPAINGLKPTGGFNPAIKGPKIGGLGSKPTGGLNPAINGPKPTGGLNPAVKGPKIGGLNPGPKRTGGLNQTTDSPQQTQTGSRAMNNLTGDGRLPSPMQGRPGVDLTGGGGKPRYDANTSSKVPATTTTTIAPAKSNASDKRMNYGACGGCEPKKPPPSLYLR